MSGLLSKGGGVGATPAQQQLLQSAIEQTKNYMNTWLPAQRYFIQSTVGNEPGIQASNMGRAGAGAVTQGSGMLQQFQKSALARGASAGSGNFLAGLTDIAGNTGGSSGAAESGAALSSDRAYMSALQKALGLTVQDQGLAIKGLSEASNIQAQEAGANASQNAANLQGAGELGAAIYSLA